MKKKIDVGLLWKTPRLKAAWAVFGVGIVLALVNAVASGDYSALVCILTIFPVLLLILQKMESSVRTVLMRMHNMNNDVTGGQETTNNVGKRVKQLADEVRVLTERVNERNETSATVVESSDKSTTSASDYEFLEMLDFMLKTAELSGSGTLGDFSPAQEASIVAVLDRIKPEEVLAVGVKTSAKLADIENCLSSIDQLLADDRILHGATCVVTEEESFAELNERVHDWSHFGDTMFLVATDTKEMVTSPPDDFVEVFPVALMYGVRAFYPQQLVES